MELTIEQALMRGIELHNKGKIQEAEQFYRAILQSDPLHADANHNLGLIAVLANQCDAALPLFKTAFEAKPQVSQFLISYIDALITQGELSLAKTFFDLAKTKGLSGDIINKFEKKLTQAPSMENANLVESADISLHKVHPQSGAPSHSMLHEIIAHYQNGDFAVAEKLALGVSNKFPNHQLAWQVLGAIFGQTGRIKESLEANKKSVEIAPTDPSAHNNLGNSLQELGRLEDAEASYLKAIALDVVYGEAHNNLGNTFLKGGKLLKARSSYNQAILAAPDLMEAHYNLGNTLSQLGRFIEAEISYTRAIDLDPNFAKAYTNSGNTFTKIGRLEDAEERYKQAIVLNPAYSEAHVNLGNLLQEIGRSDEAVVSYQNAIKLEPEACTAHYGLGNCFKELGRFKDAELCYRNALAFRPNYPEARKHLLTCLFLLEKKSSFLKEFDCSPNYGVPNAVEGSLMHRAALKFESKLTNAFCLEPLNYLAHTDLGNKYDFTSIFVDTVRAILWDRSVTIRQQPLLLGGFQSFGNIFEIDKDFTEQIQVCIRNEIELYRLSHHTSTDGYIKHWPVDYILYGWLINMKSGGQLKPHIHEAGWLSGSVYINVPHKSLPDSGSLVVSLAQDHDGSDSALNQKKIINVETGDLVLFPSSLTHYTLPFESDEDRVVLAFDVIPI